MKAILLGALVAFGLRVPADPVPTNPQRLSYPGSIRYGGPLSFIYAKLSQEDPRVVAAKDWHRYNCTSEGNPGMGLQGYFRCLHLPAETLTVAGEDRLPHANGAEVLWPDKVARNMLRLQRADGLSVNPEPRWWEPDPVLVTGYAVMALEPNKWRMP